jgi:hypothetical protein
MRQYRGIYYKPDYGYELKQNDRLVSHSKKVEGAACFARVFNFFDGKTKRDFDGTYTLKCRKKFDPRSGNFCPMSGDQVRKVLRYMRTTFEMGVGFKETDEDYVLTFKIQGKPVKHKFILTFSRVFFEYPYNEMALDIFKLREAGPINGISYRNKSFLDLYHLLHAVYSNYVGMGHALFCYTLREPLLKPLHAAFEEGLPRIHDIYKSDDTAYKKIKRWKNGVVRIDWEIGFEERAACYAENFEILKQLKNGKKKKKGVRRRARKVVRKVD